MTNTDGVYVDGRRIDTGDCSGPHSARNVLLHPDVDAAVFETARGGMLREGLGFDRCQVAVVTNIGAGDHLGLNYITTVEDLAVLKRVIVQNVAPGGSAVLNAADPIVAGDGRQLPRLGDLLRRRPPASGDGARTARRASAWSTSDGDSVVAAEGACKHRIPLAEVPITRNGTHRLPGRERDGRRSPPPGRLALDWDAHPHRPADLRQRCATTRRAASTCWTTAARPLIADYGHNPDAMRALVGAVETMPAKRRSVVISGAGDRRDEDIREQTADPRRGLRRRDPLPGRSASAAAPTARCWRCCAQGLEGAARTAHDRRDPRRIHRHRHRARAAAARRPVPDPGRPGRGGAGAHCKASGRRLKGMTAGARAA